LVAIQPGHQLVADGVYRIIRHPSYLGMFILMFGWALAFRSGAGVILAALIIPPVLARIRSKRPFCAHNSASNTTPTAGTLRGSFRASTEARSRMRGPASAPGTADSFRNGPSVRCTNENAILRSQVSDSTHRPSRSDSRNRLSCRSGCNSTCAPERVLPRFFPVIFAMGDVGVAFHARSAIVRADSRAADVLKRPLPSL
jgi:hypothetical protein